MGSGMTLLARRCPGRSHDKENCLMLMEIELVGVMWWVLHGPKAVQ